MSRLGFRNEVAIKHCDLASHTAYFFVLGHRHGGVVVVILKAAVGSAPQQETHRVHLTTATGVVQWRVAAV